ncbi:MAG: ornithine carbamoyltransferase [Acidimicrobiales bacterium]
MTRHLLDIDDLSAGELEEVLRIAERSVADTTKVLAGKGAALVFEKPSARTRSATELAVFGLGGHPVYIQGSEVGIDSRETAEDVARTLACYHSVICARVVDHRTLVRMAAAIDTAGVGVPVVNLLSDLAHPGQAVADVLTMRQRWGATRGRTLAYVGDANNVWRSLAAACAMSGMSLRLAAPKGYEPSPADLDRIARLGAVVEVTTDPAEAAAGADALYTDVWVSMGQEPEAAERRKAFEGFTVDEPLMARASSEVIVLHCLPAHRGEEISAGVLEGPHSVVWSQAANRMHAMRGLLAWLLGDDARGGVAL